MNFIHRLPYSHVAILIIDNGIGVPEEELDLIFNRFYQVDKRSQGGAGIGLSLVKNMTELMLGEILVASTKDNGSRFKIILPVTRHSIQAHNCSHQAKKANVYQTQAIDLHYNEIEEEKPNILLIEDNQDIAFYLKHILSSGYNISYASNGEAGLSKAVNEIPDVIITDIMMPKRDGLEVAQQLKENRSTNHIPIIMLTAKNTMHDRLKGLKVGADAYLIKPFNEQELMLVIRNVLNKRKVLQRYFTVNQVFPKEDSIQQDFMSEIKRIISENLSNENFGIQDLCKEIHLERTQLYRKVKAISGNSPSDYIRHMRLELGDTLMRKGNMSVREIAFSCGFKDPSYFTKCYKGKYKRLPKTVGLIVHAMSSFFTNYHPRYMRYNLAIDVSL